MFQRTMAKSDPPNTQSEKKKSTGRLTKVELHFEHDNGIHFIIIFLTILNEILRLKMNLCNY